MKAILKDNFPHVDKSCHDNSLTILVLILFPKNNLTFPLCKNNYAGNTKQGSN